MSSNSSSIGDYVDGPVMTCINPTSTMTNLKSYQILESFYGKYRIINDIKKNIWVNEKRFIKLEHTKEGSPKDKQLPYGIKEQPAYFLPYEMDESGRLYENLESVIEIARGHLLSKLFCEVLSKIEDNRLYKILKEVSKEDIKLMVTEDIIENSEEYINKLMYILTNRQ